MLLDLFALTGARCSIQGEGPDHGGGAVGILCVHVLVLYMC